MITITLNKIRENGPCEGGWVKVRKAHKHLGMDTEFPLSSVLESNNLEDTLWCIYCLPEYEKLWRKFAVWCARQVEHLMTDERSINVLNVAWRHADGLATDEELSIARTTARVAARNAWGDAAWSVAMDDAMDAAQVAACDSSRSAANASGFNAWSEEWDDAWDAARASQQKKLTEILTAGEWVD